MGYVGWIGTYEGDKNSDKVHKVDSQIVEELLALGAVLYCKVCIHMLLSLGYMLIFIVDKSASNIIGNQNPCINFIQSLRRMITELTYFFIFSKFGETVNNIIGSTLNPVNQLLSCGGSSGGKSD